MGDQCKYRTVDGGITWTLVRAETIPVDREESMSPHGLYATIQRKYKEHTDWENRVKVLKRTNQGWSVVSTLPYHYRLDGIDVIPRNGETQQNLPADGGDTAVEG